MINTLGKVPYLPPVSPISGSIGTLIVPATPCLRYSTLPYGYITVLVPYLLITYLTYLSNLTTLISDRLLYREFQRYLVRAQNPNRRNNTVTTHEATTYNVLPFIIFASIAGIKPACVWKSVITASALAPLIYRASPIDPALRPPSSQRVQHLPPFTTAPSADDRAPSPLPPVGNDISRPSSTSTQSSSAFLQHHNINNPQISLPGLSALASIASAPSPQLRYVALFLHPSTSSPLCA